MSPALRAALLFVAAALLAGFPLLWEISPHDEGLMLQAAQRMADGQWPYDDFWWNYGPGQPLLLAGAIKVLGPSLVVWRVIRVVVGAAAATLAYALVKREGGEGAALAAWLAVAGAMAFPLTPAPTATVVALGLAGVLVAPRRPLIGGLLAGVGILFRPDLGLAALAGVAIAAASRAGAIRAAASGLLAGLLLLAPFVVAGGPGRFLDQTVGFALEEQDLQRLPLPLDYDGALDPNKLLEFYFPLLLLAGFALWLALAVRRRPPLRSLALLPLAVAGCAYLLARTDEFHLVPLAAVLPVMLATSLSREELRSAWGFALAGALGVLVLHGLDRQVGRLIHRPALAEIPLPAADGVRARAGDALALGDLSRRVDGLVPAGRPIFVANPRHDLVTAGDPLLYVLLERPNPTRYDVMQPGVVTSAPVQAEMVGQLDRARPAVVVRWLDSRASRPEPGGAGRSSGVRILDRYLARRYAQVGTTGSYAILRRRPG